MAFFPTEGRAMAFRDVEALRQFVHLAIPPWQAFERRAAGRTGFPAAADGVAHDIRALSLLPARAIFVAAQAAEVPQDPPEGGGAAPDPRTLTPLETVQIGLMWRVARRIAFTMGGVSWDEW